MSLKDIYSACDDLERIPAINKENWLYELDFLSRSLPHHAHVLQVGCGNGTRIIRLHERRPDLILAGLEIDHELYDLARKNIAEAGVRANIVLGDITHPPGLSKFDYVLCLNNTLGYIPDEAGAFKHMKKLGRHSIISVYGEDFNEERAQEYFSSIGLSDYSKIKKYTQEQVESWGGKLTITPLGYLATLRN
ncbi:class I SAM-dependent methyltransferase [Candidatus Gracilibacteria bacterium]|nr:class I SAM-dependent methyltransferase [Candidatus Gracilibacteria bacterium]